MSDVIIICLLICGTVLLIAAGILISIWRESVSGDSLRRAKNIWKVEEYNRKKREALIQIEGRK